jgi:short-subunit dehydrogenase
MRSDGGVALVTGASSGLGAEMARQLAADGWRVGLTARRAVDLGRVAEEIRAAGGITAVAPADATDPESTAAAIRRIARQLGPVDLLIANAGVGLELRGRDFRVDHFRTMVDVNLVGPALAIETVLPGMIARGSGQVVGISSLAGYRGLPGSAGYSSTKAGLSALLEGLRPELRRLGVAVTVVHPGYVRTPMTQGQTNPQPFVMEVEPAARLILRGVARRQARVDFPLPMVALLRLARLLPDAIYDPVAARVLLGPAPRARR